MIHDPKRGIKRRQQSTRLDALGTSQIVRAVPRGSEQSEARQDLFLDNRDIVFLHASHVIGTTTKNWAKQERKYPRVGNATRTIRFSGVLYGGHFSSESVESKNTRDHRRVFQEKGPR